MKLSTRISFVCLLAALFTLTPAQANTPDYDVVITNVTVIDPATERVLEAKDVAIVGRTIVLVGSADMASENAETVIDGTGKYLIPGLMDMHVHTSISAVLDNSLKLFFANGVTSIRDMSADCWEPRGEIYLCLDEMRSFAAEIERAERIGPHYAKLGSPFVQSDRTNQLPKDHDPLYTPQSEEDGVKVVAYLEERGVDFIKVYHAIFPGAFNGLMQEANRRGLEVSGHIPLLLGAKAASDAGVRTIEHAKEMVTDCSSYTAEYRGAMNAMLRGEEGAAWPKEIDRLRGTVETFDPERCAQLMSALAANGTYYVPTHGTREFDLLASDPDYRSDPRLRFIGAFQLEDWQRDIDRTASASDEIKDLYSGFYQTGLRVTKIAFDQGVQVMLGTDANDTMIIPGFSAHDELARLVAAGLTPMQALQSATSVPANYLGMSGRLGRIAAGYRADLVLLDANPLDAIRNSVTINTVLFDGRPFDRAALDQILAEVEAQASASLSASAE